MHEYDESEFPELAGKLREALSPPPLDRAGEAREEAFLDELLSGKFVGAKAGAAGRGRILGMPWPAVGGLLALAAALMLTFFLIFPSDDPSRLKDFASAGAGDIAPEVASDAVHAPASEIPREINSEEQQQIVSVSETIMDASASPDFVASPGAVASSSPSPVAPPPVASAPTATFASSRSAPDPLANSIRAKVDTKPVRALAGNSSASDGVDAVADMEMAAVDAGAGAPAAATSLAEPSVIAAPAVAAPSSIAAIDAPPPVAPRLPRPSVATASPAAVTSPASGSPAASVAPSSVAAVPDALNSGVRARRAALPQTFPATPREQLAQSPPPPKSAPAVTSGGAIASAAAPASPENTTAWRAVSSADSSSGSTPRGSFQSAPPEPNVRGGSARPFPGSPVPSKLARSTPAPSFRQAGSPGGVGGYRPSAVQRTPAVGSSKSTMTSPAIGSTSGGSGYSSSGWSPAQPGAGVAKLRKKSKTESATARPLAELVAPATPAAAPVPEGKSGELRMDLFVDTTSVATLGSWTIELRFDPTKVSILRVESASGFGTAPRHDPKQFKSGRARLSESSDNTAGFGSGTMKVARVFFQSNGGGAAPFQVNLPQAVNPDGRRITARGRAQFVPAVGSARP